MENKIVYLKTYIITIVALVVLFAAALGGMYYYYENKIKSIQSEQKTNNESDITIIQDQDTSVDNVVAK